MNNRFIKALIWGGFMALLAVSMPKVAWVFRSYEGSPLPVTFFGFTFDALWLVPLLVSFCIDGLILALTYAVTQDKQKASKAGLWVFIGTLCTLSYYCNLLYNFAHEPSGALWTNWFIGAVTPLIVSGVPLFALYYTFTLSRLEGKGETLEAKATRLELEKAAKDRIKQAKQGRIIRGIGDTIKQVRQEYISIKNEGKEAGTPALNGEQSIAPGTPGTQQRDTDKMARITWQDAMVNSEQDAEIAEGINEQDATKNDTRALSASQKSVTIKEASLLLNKSESYVRTLANTGKLRTTPRNKRRILKSSIDAYQLAHNEPSKSPLKIAEGEQVKLSMIEQAMYDALVKKPEEARELKRLSQELSPDDFIAMLKERYSPYAGYITPGRVTNVMRFIAGVSPAQNGHNPEAITDALELVNLGEQAG